MLEEVTGYKSNDHFSSLLRARELINNAADDIYRLPLEDMIKYCEDNLNNTPVSKDKSEENTVTSSEKANFKNQIERVKKLSESCDEAEERDLLLELEDANRDFDNAKSSADLVYLYVENIIDEEIDKENKVVTVYMPTNADLTKCSFEVLCSGTSEAAILEETINLSSECVIPVYCKDSGKYTNWNVNVVKVDKNEWTTSEYDRNLISKQPDEKTHLSPYILTYINSKFFDTNEWQKIVFTPKGTVENKLSLIFSAGDGKRFDHQSHNSKNDHLRLEIKNGIGKIIKSENGVNTVIKDNISVPLNFNEENEVGVKALYETNGMYLYSIVVNGQLQEVFITDKKFTSGYTGICSEEMSIVVNSDNA